MTRQYKIIYPSNRYMKESTILEWARDEWFNHADSYICCACGKDTLTVDDCIHDADMRPVYKDNLPHPKDVEDAIDLLSDLGVATFARY